MNITFEEADKIREALKPGATQDKRYEAIAILDAAEKKQREKEKKEEQERKKAQRRREKIETKLINTGAQIVKRGLMKTLGL